jgi:hypothetical protein
MSSARLTITDGTSIAAYWKATNTNSATRDWTIITNYNNFGDFSIRQGNSQGADATVGTDRLLISSGGNVGIGTSSPSAALDIDKAEGLMMRVKRTGVSGEFQMYQGPNVVYLDSAAASGNLAFATVGTERMRITSGGNVLIGTTTDSGYKLAVTQTSGSPASYFYNSATSGRVLVLQKKSGDTGDFFIVCDNVTDNKFLVNGAGTIYAVNTTVQSVSDLRFKENIRDLETGLSEILALKPRRFDWKEGKGMDIKNSIGFIAQEVEEVLPDLVKDDWINNASDNTSYKSLGMTNMIPTLVKAIQEQQAQIEELKAKILSL